MVVAWILKFSSCVVTCTVFCIGIRQVGTTIICGEMLGTPTQCHTIVKYNDVGQKTRLN